MELVCKKCGLVNDYRTEQKAHNKTAWCNGCDSFIKNIQYSDKQIMYFGKYKGLEISSINEVSYLEWMVTKVRLSAIQSEAAYAQLNKLMKNN